MKIDFSKRPGFYSFVVTCIIFLVFILVSNGNTPDTTFKFAGPHYVYVDTKLQPFDASIPDSIIQQKRLYDRMDDSIKRARIKKDGDMPRGGNWYFPPFFIGTSENLYCDTCDTKWYGNSERDEQQHICYGIELLGWKLNVTHEQVLYNDDSVLYHIEHNRPYIREYVALTSKMKNNEGLVYQNYGAKDVPVKFNYSRRDQSIIIPVSKSVKTIFDIIFGIFDVIVYGYFIILLRKFLDFVLDISKGLAFIDQNVLTLKRIALTFLLYPAIAFLGNLLIGLIFINYFTSDVKLSKGTWGGAWKNIIIGLLFLALYKAFKQGKKLKDDQELTI